MRHSFNNSSFSPRSCLALQGNGAFCTSYKIGTKTKQFVFVGAPRILSSSKFEFPNLQFRAGRTRSASPSGPQRFPEPLEKYFVGALGFEPRIAQISSRNFHGCTPHIRFNILSGRRESNSVCLLPKQVYYRYTTSRQNIEPPSGYACPASISNFLISKLMRG